MTTDASIPNGLATRQTQVALANIELWNPLVNAMITVTADEARETAAELDRAAAEGDWRGLLHGMTLSLKDCVDMQGVRTTGASKILENNVAVSDAHIVQRLRRNGAVIVGKANLHEFCFGPTSQSRHFGAVRNPWDRDCIAGGSSGGSGAAVASGMCMASIGSDTGGSIRIPASLNGIAGLRPTIGRISNRGSLAVSPAFDTLGPMAHRVSDVARIFAAIAGHDPDDPTSVDQPLPNFLPQLHDPVQGMRIGIMRRWYFDGLDPQVERAMDQALLVFRDLGVQIVEVDLGDAEQAHPLLALNVLVADALQLHAQQVQRRAADYGPDLLVRFSLGEHVSGVQYAHALRWMESWRHRLRRVFGGVDALLSPTTPFPAPATGRSDFAALTREIGRFTYGWSFAGVPALSVPCGFTHDGRPLAFQLAGRWFDEPALLRLGHAYQAVTAHHLRRPVNPKG